MKTGLGIQNYREIIERFVELIQQELKDNLVSVVLYGSVAREEASPQSDIDLLIIQDQGSPHYYERLEPIISAEKKLRDTEVYLEFEKEKWKVTLENGTWYWDLKPDLVAGEIFEL
jgi:predicted nucleotidyltransferase